VEVTTRKMTRTDVENLQSIQRHLKKKGLKISQQELLGKIVDYISENELDFIENINEDNSEKDQDLLDKWLSIQVKGTKSNAVLEHDEVN
jgi:Mg2+ and Co2+ transporter CorA